MNIEKIIKNKECLNKLFFLLFYEGFIEEECHFIFNETLYCDITDNRQEELIVKCFENENSRLERFFSNLLINGINSKYNIIVKEYK